jgi:hypothetical protein
MNMKYQVVYGPSLNSLVHEVNLSMEEGWEIAPSMFIASSGFYQPMTKKTPPKRKARARSGGTKK